MRGGFCGKKKRTHFANGGLIQGPGTGTSDDIDMALPQGSYVMPADSTQQLGVNNLAQMGEQMPVSVSNGEYQLPPEQVHAIGVQTLDNLKGQTHQLAGQVGGFKPRAMFADGGVVDEEELRRRRMYVDSTGRTTNVLPSQGTGLVPAGPRTSSGLPARVSQPGTGMMNVPQPVPVRAPDGSTVFVDRSGRATSVLPSQSTSMTAPQQGPRFTAPNTGPAVVSGSPAPAPGIGGFGPRQGRSSPPNRDWQARAEGLTRAKRDTAAFQQAQAAQDAKFAAAATPPQAPPAQKQPTMLDKARGVANKVAPLSAGLLAVPALLDAAEDDSTARYAERFGIPEPTGDGSVGDIAQYGTLRGLGFASEVGSTMTGGLSEALYRDKQRVDTDQLAATGGAIAGGYGGNKVGGFVGKGVDALGRVVTRGRYSGNLAERALRNVGTLGGAVGGIALSQQLMADDAVPQPATGDPYEPAPPPDDMPLENDIKQVGNSFSGTNIGAGYTVNGRPSSEVDPLVYHADNPSLAGAQNRLAKQRLFASTPEYRQGTQGGGTYAGGQAPGGFGPRAAGSGGGGGTARLIRNSGTPSNGEILRERMRGQREQVAQRGQQISADTNLRQQGVDIQRNTAEANLERDRAERAVAARAEQRMEALRQRYEQADTQEEKQAIALAIRDMLGQARPAYQIARTDRLVDPSDPQSQKLTETFVVDPATSQARIVSAALPPINQNPAVHRILKDKSLSREERARQIRDLGYP